MLGLLVVWGVGVIVGMWIYRRHVPELALHTLTFLLLLPAAFPVKRTVRTVPDLAVDVSQSMQTEAKQAFVANAIQQFRNRYPRAQILAFAERTVPFERREDLRGTVTHPPRLTRPAVVLTDGLWEGWEAFPHPVWPWLPETIPSTELQLDAPLTASPGPITLQVRSSRPGTLRVGNRLLSVSAGTTTLRISLSPGFHRLIFVAGEDTLRRGVLVRSREIPVGIFTTLPHPDAGALRRVLRDLGYAPFVVLKDRILWEDRVETGSPPRAWGWFVLDPPGSLLPGMWWIRMDRALEGARWSPHPLHPGVLLAHLPGMAPDSLDLVSQGPKTWAWVLGDVYRMGLREPDSLKRRLGNILERMKARFPRIQIYPVADTVVPPDTARFLVEVAPPDAPVHLSLPARVLEPGLFAVALAVPDTGMRETTLVLTYGEGADTLILRVQGILREERPTERVDEAFLEGLARSTGGWVIRGEVLGRIPLAERTETWPWWWSLLGAALLLLGRWGVQYRRGRT